MSALLQAIATWAVAFGVLGAFFGVIFVIVAGTAYLVGHKEK